MPAAELLAAGLGVDLPGYEQARVEPAGLACRVPEPAVLSAMAHGWSEPGRGDVLDVLPDALAAVGPDHADLHHDIVLAARPAAAQR